MPFEAMALPSEAPHFNNINDLPQSLGNVEFVYALTHLTFQERRPNFSAYKDWQTQRRLHSTTRSIGREALINSTAKKNSKAGPSATAVEIAIGCAWVALPAAPRRDHAGTRAIC
jgi:hypothetical protein